MSPSAASSLDSAFADASNSFDSQPTGSTSTPCSAKQPQPVAAKTWIEILVQDFLGFPVPNEPVRVQLDNGTVREGKTNPQGKVRFEGIDPGSGIARLLQRPDWQPDPEAPPKMTGATPTDTQQAPQGASSSNKDTGPSFIYVDLPNPDSAWESWD